MNLRILLFSALVSVGTVKAGSFGGPPPFTNGSPLPTGTDGLYQGVATGTNLTGLFTFEISGGSQTSTTRNNTWVFFVDGNILSGGTQANISQGKVTGILDSSAQRSLTGDGGTIQGSVAYIVPGNAATGYFKGDIDLGSPVGSFSGYGKVSGTPARTDQLVYIMDLSGVSITATGSSTVIIDPVTVTTINVPGSSLPESRFNFRGTRLRTGPSVSTTDTSSSSSTQ
ncbi:hypothetical protein TSACC_22358 [Terrimicrobium sacchariphilum]|jgi:hypothetical protein|uniref:Uncharacterized protein n=1 Tax=Terrimicrobium sacchariphilum TaxID=690879 RepID=A0A146GAW9_TERSA|nr:hypothetical protein [Terrimicrobium sacchariphilum]GAT33937.1 hypothetical protein TSACC_22358 [Terrimicrobium sacchariphilum]